ncbi:XRE family transcriptional regulator [Pseudonocardia sichuanensis]
MMIPVPNDRLRAAIAAAGLTIEDVSARVAVDPKTVERWVSNGTRRPHRKTRQRVAQLLRAQESYLWPQDDRHPGTANPSSGDELLRLYPSRSAVPFTLWTELINSVTVQMDVLVFSGQFLVEQHDVLPIVRKKAADGARFRFLIGHEEEPAVKQRAREEGTTGGLEGRVQMMRRYLREVSELDNVEVRTHGTILYTSIYRFDQSALVNGHAYGTLAGQSPVMHLRRIHEDGIWEHYMRSFERVWEIATPDEGSGHDAR